MKRFIPLCTQRILWPLARVILVVFLHYRVRGLENLKLVTKDIQKKGVIFATNHTSEMDPVFATGALPLFSRFLPMFLVTLDREHYQNEKFGWRAPLYGGFFFYLLGGVPAVLGAKDYEISLANHVPLMNAGYSLCYFPEGKINRGNPREVKGGISYLVWKTGATVVPLNIDKGFGKIGFKGLFSGKRQVTVTFGKPIFAEELFSQQPPTIEDFKKTANDIMDTVWDLGSKEIVPKSL